jgi:hypothetical protein
MAFLCSAYTEQLFAVLGARVTIQIKAEARKICLIEARREGTSAPLTIDELTRRSGGYGYSASLALRLGGFSGLSVGLGEGHAVLHRPAVSGPGRARSGLAVGFSDKA